MARLPPFFALRALEAAARHRSYSGAARELAVTHGAVSQQIRKLEAELGARLFVRQGNLMIPTREAARLAEQVARGVGVLQNAVAEFAAAAERDPLVVSVGPQFATRWLPSRLQKLLADPAGSNLALRSEDRYADFLTDGVDMAIRFGAGRWDGVEAVRLFTETLFPVCSPELAAIHPMREPRDVLTAPLVHHVHRPWSLWFDAFNLPRQRTHGPQFEDSVLVVEAAAQGLGVALARSGIVEADLASGRLVRPIPAAIPSELGFYAVWRPGNRKIGRILALTEWLIAEAEAGGSAAAGPT